MSVLWQVCCHSYISTRPSEQITSREDFSFTDVFAMINEAEDSDEILDLQYSPIATKQTSLTLPRNLLRSTEFKTTGSSRREKYRSLDETQLLEQQEARITSNRKMTVIPTSSKFADLSRSFEVIMLMCYYNNNLLLQKSCISPCSWACPYKCHQSQG